MVTGWKVSTNLKPSRKAIVVAATTRTSDNQTAWENATRFGLQLQRQHFKARPRAIKVDVDPLARVRYSCFYWVDHLCEMGSSLHHEVGLYDDGTIHTFLKKHFLYWLEALSLMKSTSYGVVMVRKLENLLRVSFSIPYCYNMIH